MSAKATKHPARTPTRLKPLRIGPIEVTMPVVLAPLAGYSDLAYRRICRELGAGYAGTEMLLDRTVLAGRTDCKRLTASHDEDHPLAGQLIGSEPQELAAAAVKLDAMGMDVIDLNFGCPVRKVLRRGRGGKLLGDPDRAVRIIRGVLEVTDRPVTLKLRRAFAEKDDGSACLRIAAEARELGVAAVRIHPRSVEAGYRGPADWSFLRRIRREFPEWTLIGSGDVLTPADALRMLEETGVDGVAAARGALGNPWFFAQVSQLSAGEDAPPPTLAEQARVLRRHFRYAVEVHGAKQACRRMRSFGIRYSRLHPRAKALRAAFVAVETADDWQRVIGEYYDGGGNG
ncbi:MAG: tRNA dihydrouridine synthase [Phycisphaerae bacterium]